MPLRPLHLVPILALFPLALAAQEFTRRVSIATGGAQGNGTSGANGAWLSSDGRFVAFASAASNLILGDSNGFDDVFVHDRVTGVTERVSNGRQAEQPNGHSGGFERDVSISADGNLVVFCSNATNLVAGSVFTRHVYLHNRIQGQTSLVSATAMGAANRVCGECRLAAGGSAVVFTTASTNLVPNDTNNLVDVFVSGPSGMTRVSVSSTGTQAAQGGQTPSISDDGRFVAFESFSNDLVSGDTNNLTDVFVHDRSTGQTTRVSVSSTGAQANGTCEYAWISGDGNRVIFRSGANNLVDGDTNNTVDAFVHDRRTGVTTRVSLDSAGAQVAVTPVTSYPILSRDGRYAAFASAHRSYVAGDNNVSADAFVHDLATGITSRASVDSDGGEATVPSGSTAGRLPFLSADGSLIAFGSDATNLVVGDSNGVADVFVRRHAPAALTLAAPPRVNQPVVLQLTSVFDGGNLHVAALSFGNRQGIPLGARTIPLQPDALFTVSLSAPSFFTNFLGTFDGAGHSTASFVVPPQLLNVPFYAAFVTVRNGAPSGFGAFSNERLLVPGL